ncbi:endonuclease/exonuclease/phosphatase family protein [candidate division KSB1 bacterium]|nr:endonuclease/exonuclease/phosphatase family protein [candidate division KSB1 bacterium]MBL7093650.1 endonuclease/exonuclease/phosphatase family protein [candidate division KSB1 bacterium]
MFKKKLLLTLLSLFLIISLLPTISFPKITNPESIKVLSFNIRYDNPNDGINQWANRKELATRTIQKFQVDIVGMQEVLKNQLDDCLKLMEEYSYCGVARNDGKNSGEFSPIFFLKDRFELLQDSTMWLSETPAVIGSKSWDAALPRIVTWAKLRDKQTQNIFYFFNTHFDHRGKTARKESAELIKKIIREVVGKYPAILTGDFNCTEDDAPYQVLTNDESELINLKDAYYLSAKNNTGINYTFNGWAKANGSRRIDFIFVNPKLRVQKHSILDIREGDVFISDHFPVLAEIRIKD